MSRASVWFGNRSAIVAHVFIAWGNMLVLLRMRAVTVHEEAHLSSLPVAQGTTDALVGGGAHAAMPRRGSSGPAAMAPGKDKNYNLEQALEDSHLAGPIQMM